MGEQLPEEEAMAQESFWQQSGKMVVLLQLLEAWQKAGNRALIFTQTRTVPSHTTAVFELMLHRYFRC